MKKKTVRDAQVSGKRVLLRVDFNVPFVPKTTVIADDTRIQAVLPTIRYLKKRGASLVVCSHLGRPNGKVVKDMRLDSVAHRFEALLGEPIVHVRECIGPAVQQAVKELGPGEVLLLENLRFYPEEEKNDPEFAKALASLADIYVNDAFGASHRAHASINAITRFLPAYAGLQMEKELKMLGATLENPARPLGAIMGGAKISDKINVLHNLVQRVDRLFIGGGMAATFFKAQGLQVGSSLVEEESIGVAQDILKKAQSNSVKLFLPEDVVISKTFAGDAPHKDMDVARVPPGWMIMDIGPETARLFAREMRECRTLVWNGPMGVFEWEVFSQGTRAIAETMADMNNAITVVGGGSTAEAVEELGLTNAMNHVSMGGGASLEFLEGRDLPGISTLPDKDGD
ncbi:MAG: phosphoglycerate kinase [Chloroflexi bacterium]|nr:phosphoglycerate kinase [Chloroflexota bacterium]